MQRVEVRRVRLVLRLPDSQEADDDAWDGAGVEKCVTQLDNQVRAAATDAVEQHGLREGKCDLSMERERRLRCN